MISVKENTTLVGVSELRTNPEAVFKQMRKSRVILEKRNRPVAVLLSIEQYEEIERAMEWLEDQSLGYLAHVRERQTPRTQHIPLSDAEKRVGLR